jgi:Protein of unknown function (DUF1488)
MTLAFPNPSRSFDEAMNAVLFFGHDGVFEIRFFVEAGALAISGTALPTMPMSEARCLSVFDAVRTPFWTSRERRTLTDVEITTLSPPLISDRGGRC